MTQIVEIVKVGIAEKDVVEPPKWIRTSGLGSCVGLVLYDEFRKIAGLVHVMLPDSALSKSGIQNPSKYADTAVKELIRQMIESGGRRGLLKAKLAGGAQMFQFQSATSLMRIGPRNVEAILEQLDQMRIPVVSMDVGGSSGRTIEFDPFTCMMHIRTVNQGSKTI
jgi:chemotaxis protein CheD